ncbi:hypothetical protein ABZ369_06550 [Streptomyces sp. NPDC005918]|uniref:hypothetical protein n=1 Tax=Streptomyces sp. NPDC005918 TaxID=3155454 RepID=UPI0033EBEC5D
MSTDPTVFRAEDDGIPLAHYGDREQARAHCLHKAQNDPLLVTPTRLLDLPLTHSWVIDGPDPDEAEDAEELHLAISGEVQPTGYTVTPITVAARFDPEAEEWEADE